MLQAVLREPHLFSLTEVDPPHPGPGEVLIKVECVHLTPRDLAAVHGNDSRFAYPQVPGSGIAGEIASLGPGTSQLRVGDPCSIDPYLNCGQCEACQVEKPNCCEQLKILGNDLAGGLRQYLCVRADKVHVAPKLSAEQRARATYLASGAHVIERANVQPGDLVLLYGANSLAVSILPFIRVTRAHVILIEEDPDRLSFFRDRLGVKHALSPSPSMAQEIRRLSQGHRADVVIATRQASDPTMPLASLVGPGGRLVLTPASLDSLNSATELISKNELTVTVSTHATPSTFRAVVRMVENGLVDTSAWTTHELTLETLAHDFSALPRNTLPGDTVLVRV